MGFDENEGWFLRVREKPCFMKKRDLADAAKALLVFRHSANAERFRSTDHDTIRK
jgi:hypothetical protein